MRSLKSVAQSGLKRIHLYERAKASLLYDVYWKIADRHFLDCRDREVAFYKSVLQEFRPGDLIFDVGANHGYKTDIFLRLGAKVVAVDPDKANQTVLEEKFLKYRFAKKPVYIVGKAVSDKAGVEILWMDEPGSAKNTLNEKWVRILRVDQNKFGQPLGFKESVTVETVQLEDLMNEYGLPFFVKIDVEGHELKVLEGLRRPVPYLSFEVNLPEFRAEGAKCMELLEQLAPEGQFNYSTADGLKLAADSWLNLREFMRIFNQCGDSSVEVFWKTLR